jgi:octaprenyl-diphosphate synthase
VLNKNMGDDFREGKLTLPVILAIRAADADERAFWQSALQVGMADFHAGTFARAQKLLQQHDVFSGVQSHAQHHANAAIAALSALPAHPLLDALAAIPTYVLTRSF